MLLVRNSHRKKSYWLAVLQNCWKTHEIKFSKETPYEFGNFKNTILWNTSTRDSEMKELV